MSLGKCWNPPNLYYILVARPLTYVHPKSRGEAGLPTGGGHSRAHTGLGLGAGGSGVSGGSSH